MSSENEQKRGIKIPQKPPMFCMLLRKYLEGAKISDSKVVENERIFELVFETYDELSEKRILCLCVELMGKHSNVILYDFESKIIIGCAHNVGSEKSRYRELQGGLKYIYPPQNNGIQLPNELKEQFKTLSQEKIQEYLSAETYRPAIKGDKYTLFNELLPDSVPQNSVSEMLDNYYSSVQEGVNLKSEKLKLSEITNSKLKKVKNSISKIETLLKKRDNTEKYKLYGELLTANLYQKKDYSKFIELLDYNSGENLKIDLDETKTLNENAQRYFRLYTKSKATKEKSMEMLDSLNKEREYLENVLYGVESAENLNDLEDVKQELGISEETKKKSQKEINIEKQNIYGFDVYIGKNNKQNDYIVSKLAKDEDIWFHTRQCAGSHVLLKTNGREPDEKVLFECCKLARKYSSSTLPSKVGVIYTKAKNLKKPPAAHLGYVTYRNEKEILV